jgi:hypothetical protein
MRTKKAAIDLQESEREAKQKMPEFSKFVLTDYEQRVFRILYKEEKALSTFEVYRHLIADIFIDLARGKSPILAQKEVHEGNKVIDVEAVFADLKNEFSKSEFDQQLKRMAKQNSMPRYGLADRILSEAAAVGWVKTRQGSGKVKVLYFLDTEMRQKVKNELLSKISS